MKDGATSKVVVLNKGHIAKARAKSDSADKDWSPWNTDEEAMWLKTAAHRLAKWVPTSAEYMREQIRAKAVVDSEQRPEPLPVSVPAPAPGTVDDDYDDEPVEGELVD
jgi:recombination protein RecT